MRFYWAFRYFVALVFTPRNHRNSTFLTWTEDLKQAATQDGEAAQ